MKKIMKERFMFVGTLEEAEFNRVVSVAGVHGTIIYSGSLQVGTGITVRASSWCFAMLVDNFCRGLSLFNHFSRLTG